MLYLQSVRSEAAKSLVTALVDSQKAFQKQTGNSRQQHLDVEGDVATDVARADDEQAVAGAHSTSKRQQQVDHALKQCSPLMVRPDRALGHYGSGKVVLRCFNCCIGLLCVYR